MSVKQEWGVRIKVLIITALIASLGNVLATWKDVRDGVEGASIVMPWETLSVMVVKWTICCAKSTSNCQRCCTFL